MNLCRELPLKVGCSLWIQNAFIPRRLPVGPRLPYDHLGEVADVHRADVVPNEHLD